MAIKNISMNFKYCKNNRCLCRLLGSSVALILIVYLMTFEGFDVTINSGNFYGLKIGMSKKDVAAILLSQGVPNVEPVVDKDVVVKIDSIELLSQLQKASGICVGDNKDFALRIAFDANGMSRPVDNSVNVDPIALGLRTSQPRKEVLERIEKIISSRKGIVVANCILDVRSVDLNNSSSRGFDNLERFNSWLYYLPNTYSMATLRFTDGKLVKIDYSWRPYETM